MRLLRAAEVAESGAEETMALAGLPRETLAALAHHQPARATAVRDTAAHTRGGITSRLQSPFSPAAVRQRQIAGTRWSTKRYGSMDLLNNHSLDLQAA